MDLHIMGLPRNPEFWFDCLTIYTSNLLFIVKSNIFNLLDFEIRFQDVFIGSNCHKRGA